MTDAIAHRGPDSEGVIDAPFARAGFRRLAIIDLESGDQPVPNESRTVWVFLNGEIYNYLELRQELEAKGHRFATSGDTETIPHLYEEYGDAFAEKLNGMFAICLVDLERRRVLLARDRLGVKPLYWASFGEGIVFGSELKALLASDLVPAELEPASIVPFLNFFYVPGQDTLLRGVRKVGPGEMLVVEDGAVVQRRRWYDLGARLALQGGGQPSLGELDALLEDCVQRRLLADVPVCISLSGGLDSSLIAMYVARRATGRVAAVSIHFQGQGFADPDLEHAKLVTERLGLEHVVLTASASDFMGEIADMVWFADEPVADPAFYSALKVAQEAKQVAKVILSGTGADEIFAGYGHYLLSAKAKLVLGLPAPLRPLVLRLMGGGLSADKRAALLTYRRSRLLWHLNEMSHLSAAERRELAAYLETPDRCLTSLANWFGGRFPGDGLNEQLYADIGTYLADQLLPVLDRTTMAHSIEGREPYLDYRLVEMAFRFAGPVKLDHRDERKALLKALGRDGLPHQVIERPKIGFPAGVFHWLSEEFGQHVRSVLLAPGGLAERYLPAPWVGSLFASPQAMRANARKIYALLVLQIWHELFLVQKAKSPPRVHLSDLFGTKVGVAR